MRDRRDYSRVTVCTPTYMATRKNPRASMFLGWILFVMFMMALALLGLGLIYVFSTPMRTIIKNIIIATFLSLIFLVLVMMFLVDVLSSIEDNTVELVDYSRKIEQNTYNLYVLLSKAEREKRG